MNTTIQTPDGVDYDITIWHARHKFTGRGHWTIEIDVHFDHNGKTHERTFRHTTTDSDFIDMISEMKHEGTTSEALIEAYYDYCFERFMDEECYQWIEMIVQ